MTRFFLIFGAVLALSACETNGLYASDPSGSYSTTEY